MKSNTHLRINPDLCGIILDITDTTSQVTLRTTPLMAVDEFELVHGGFIFGLADYAAMLAVNDPNVVLAGAQVRFRKPVRVGEILHAKAIIVKREGAKITVAVHIFRDTEEIFEGDFTCVILGAHALQK